MHEPWIALLGAVIFVVVVAVFLRLVLKKMPREPREEEFQKRLRVREYREPSDKRLVSSPFRVARGREQITNITKSVDAETISALAEGPVIASVAALLNESKSVCDLPSAREGRDNVECSVFAKPNFYKGRQLAIRAYLHVADDAARVARLAVDEDKSANRLARQSLFCEIARGALVDIFLDCPGLAITQPLQTIHWEGMPERVVFLAAVPAQIQEQTLNCRLFISVNDIPVGDITFKLYAATEKPEPTTFMPMGGSNVPTVAHAYSSAFISYSRKDFEGVSLFAQGLSEHRIKLCFDVTSFEPGEDWAQSLQSHIEDADAFYLMWSSNAATSQWVDMEARYATKLHDERETDRPRIVPITLSRPVPAPPDYLKRFHFNSPWLSQRTAEKLPLFEDK